MAFLHSINLSSSFVGLQVFAWEPGTISVAPFCSVKSSSSQMLLALAGHGGSGSGKGVSHEVSVALLRDVECLLGNYSDETVDDWWGVEK